MSHFLRDPKMKAEFFRIVNQMADEMGLRTVQNSNQDDRQVSFCSTIVIFTYLMFSVPHNLY